MTESPLRPRGLRCTDDEWEMTKSESDRRGLTVREFIIRAVRDKCEGGAGQGDSTGSKSYPLVLTPAVQKKIAKMIMILLMIKEHNMQQADLGDDYRAIVENAKELFAELS